MIHKETQRSILRPTLPQHMRYEPGFWTMTTWIQIFYAIWVNQVLVVLGMAYGFSAVAIPQMSRDNDIEGIDLDAEAWIASTITLCAPIGCLFCGLLMDRIGRRPMEIICAIPMAIGWFVTGFAVTSDTIVIGRLITGLGGGMAASPPRAYCTEIALPKIRGVIGVFPTLALSIGIVTQAVMGNFLKWRTMCYISGSYSALLAFVNFYLPETPYFVLMTDTISEAEACLRRFRGGVSRVDLEIHEMVKYRDENQIRKLSFKESVKVLFTPAACRPFGIIVVFIIVGQMSGVTIVLFYAVDILQDSNLSINPYIGNVVLAISRFIGGIIGSILMYKMKRRSLSLMSAGSISLLTVILGCYLKKTKARSFFPLISWSMFMFCATLGYLALPLLMLFELIPLQIRGLLGGITVSIWTFTIFCVNYVYLHVKNFLGFPNVVLGFGIVSFIGCFFLFLYLPETKGLSLPEIEEYYNKKRKYLASDRDHLPLVKQHKEHSKEILHMSKLMLANERNSLDQEVPLKRGKSSVTFITDKEGESSKDGKKETGPEKKEGI